MSAFFRVHHPVVINLVQFNSNRFSFNLNDFKFSWFLNNFVILIRNETLRTGQIIDSTKIGVECIKWNKKSGEELTFTAAQIMITPLKFFARNHNPP